MNFVIAAEEKSTVIYAVLVALSTGMILLLYNYKIDPYKNIERFYFKKSKAEYAIFKLTYALILLSCILSAKFLVIRFLLGK